MSVVSDEDYAANPEQSKKYCDWCWGHAYGNCSMCAVRKNAPNPEPEPNPAESAPAPREEDEELDESKDFKLIETGFGYWATTLNRVAARLALGRLKKRLATEQNKCVLYPFGRGYNAGLFQAQEEFKAQLAEVNAIYNSNQDQINDAYRQLAERERSVNDFRMDTLDAVMHSVRKWLPDDYKEVNPETTAADAREIALKAIEKAEGEAKALREALDSAGDRAEAWLWGDMRGRKIRPGDLRAALSKKNEVPGTDPGTLERGS